MHLSESLPVAHESTANVHERLANLAAKLKPGLNVLTGNEELEGAYLEYRATILDEQYKEMPNFYRFDQLPGHEQAQANTMVDQLVYMGIASASILAKRLQRMRYLMVDTHNIGEKEMGGEFIDGLAIVAWHVDSRPRSPEQRNFAVLHETGHGLSVTNAVGRIGTNAIGSTIGLQNIQHIRGMSEDQLSRLHDAEETIVDALALSVSDMDAGNYLSGKFPGVGYWRKDNALAELATSNPDLVMEMWKATFATGLQSTSQGITFAEACAARFPDLNN